MPHVTLVWMLVMIGVLAAVWWGVQRLGGHDSAPDGAAFTCRVQPLDELHQPAGAWRDATAVVGPGWVDLQGRNIRVGRYEVLGESSGPPPGSAVFALELGSDRYVIQVPAGSPAAARLRGQDPDAA